MLRPHLTDLPRMKECGAVFNTESYGLALRQTSPEREHGENEYMETTKR